MNVTQFALKAAACWAAVGIPEPVLIPFIDVLAAGAEEVRGLVT